MQSRLQNLIFFHNFFFNVENFVFQTFLVGALIVNERAFFVRPNVLCGLIKFVLS